MTTYFIVIFIVFFCCFIAEKNLIKRTALDGGDYGVYKNSTAKFFLFIVVAILTLVSGFRYFVGTDYGSYILIYNDAKSANGINLFDITNEYGFQFLCKLSSVIYDDPTMMFLLTAVLTVIPFLYSTFKETNDVVFVALLYIFTGCWHGSFNGMRQYLAATIIYLGRHYIVKHKFLKYFLVCFVAFLFHRSAIFGILFYFVYSDKFSYKRLFVIIAATLLLSYNYEAIFSFIGWLDNEEFVLNEYSTNSVNLLRVLVHICPAILAMYFIVNKKIEQKHIFYVYMLVVDAAIYISMSNSAYLTRLGIFSSAFLSLGLSYITKPVAKKYYKIVRILILIFYFLFWFYDISKTRSLNNFRFVFGI